MTLPESSHRKQIEQLGSKTPNPRTASKAKPVGKVSEGEGKLPTPIRPASYQHPRRRK